jgi:DNA-binding XRE family transcriptional regulator
VKNRLDEVMNEKGFKAKDLQSALEVDRSTVYRWLTNDVQPSDENKVKIADLLRTPIGDIFFQKLVS